VLRTSRRRDRRLGDRGRADFPDSWQASARVSRIRVRTRQVVLLLAQEGGRLVKSLDVAVEIVRTGSTTAPDLVTARPLERQHRALAGSRLRTPSVSSSVPLFGPPCAVVWVCRDFLGGTVGWSARWWLLCSPSRTLPSLARACAIRPERSDCRARRTLPLGRHDVCVASRTARSPGCRGSATTALSLVRAERVCHRRPWPGLPIVPDRQRRPAWLGARRSGIRLAADAPGSSSAHQPACGRGVPRRR
jgi:hypothetical protein